MGKKLIIKGADFSAVAVDSLLTLDSIAWDGKTYREIFETNNLLGISPGFENGSYSPLVINSGNPIITNEVADSGTYSLKCFGSTSQQVKLTGQGSAAIPLVYYFLAARVKVDSYTQGKIGVIIGSSGATIERTTSGFETITLSRKVSDSSLLFFVGSASSANLDGYVDTPVAIISTYFSVVPTIEQFTQLYNQYVAIKKGS